MRAPEKSISSQAQPVIEHEGFGSQGEGRDIFFAAVESTRMPMIVTDPRLPDNPIVFSNNAFEEMTQYRSDELLGRNCRFLQGPETDRATVTMISRCVAERTQVSTEILNYRKDGSSFWNALFITPLFNAQGELIYFFASQLDISRRKDAEAALGQAQKMEALGQLTGGIAHDFNNLLQVMLANASIIERRQQMLGLHDETLQRAAASLKASVQKAATFTQQLLAFARKQALQGRVVGLNEVVSTAVEMAERSLGTGMRVELQLAPDLPNCRIDITQAELAILNLLINARDAMQGSGRVTLRTELITDALRQHDEALDAGRYVCLSVSDDGPGIAPEILPRVMDPFFTTKPPGQGTGLGLSMVYGFAKQSGGSATIRSEPGRGTTVRLYFPVTSEAATEPDAAALPQTAHSAGARILIVDDRIEIAEIAAAMLESEGFTAQACGSANEALNTMRNGAPFALLLTDLIMPGAMNGVLLAREAQRLHPGLKVLLMTGFADGAPQRWGGEHFDIIFKPYGQNDLVKKVRQILDRGAAHA